MLKINTVICIAFLVLRLSKVFMIDGAIELSRSVHDFIKHSGMYKHLPRVLSLRQKATSGN